MSRHDVVMNDEEAPAEIVQTLTVDHGCHAVILCGSRVRGDFQPTSDWDVAGIREADAAAPSAWPLASQTTQPAGSLSARQGDGKRRVVIEGETAE
jgi:hypothetical protein